MTEKEIKINGFEKYLTNCSDCNIKKQLKRKEQECEELRAKYKTLLLEHSGCYRKEWVDEQIRIKKIYEEDRQNYGQALQAIKNVAENILIECNNCDQYSCSGCPDENKEELAQQILQKCEVINAR